ncbi:lectin [Kitasatospora cineracea]|uniref:Putative alpha-1,2-mannosidase n=1 Tax=Kitasatospora cineracea TaxID=88074 RepID=A0A8G1ULU1_9ACTN|nr:lectin [Kitasatospora cineracea]ROR46362.1 putative alpha-1,2-mannosidase [Kitasatospora cineracea]
MKRWRLPLAACLVVLGLATPAPAQAAPAAAAAAVSDPASLVNPLLGTSHEGNTFPGADSPFGMVQWSPDTPSRPPGGDYAYTDNTITGFSLNHLSGPGCGAMGDVPVLPTTGGVDGRATVGFSHAKESASAGAYAVTLDNGVTTELTTTARSGMARFTFPATTQANLLFKLSADKATNLHFTKVSSTEVSGSVDAGLFCASSAPYTAYFDMVFDRPITSTGTFDGGNSVTFDTTGNRTVQAKVGLSYVSVAGATANRAAENPNWDFNAVRTANHDAWNAALGRIAVSGGTPDQQKVFYTALYHALLHPNLLSDSDGKYWGFDRQVHTVSGRQKAQYGTYSGWDIYRTQAQLEALVAPQQASDSAQSLVNDFAQSGQLPKWSLNSAETNVMNGDPAPAVIADYYAFGARDFDTAAAKDAMVRQASAGNGIRLGLDYQSNYGYLPSDGSYLPGFYGSVATQLEYAAQDFAISAFAGALGDNTARDQFANRAQDWRNVFNPASGFMQPKLKDGTWRGGFDPTSSDQFVEGTSWQYTGAVPHNVRGLADAMGGNAKLAAYLDAVLADFHGSGGSHADLGNEPSVELPWEYDYIGQPWKTQKTVRDVQNQLWPNDPANWRVGNDDLGTMSAWYVFSAMGFYPQTPGTADLALGSPLFTNVTVTLAGGGRLVVNAPQAATDAPYVQSATLNGASWNNAYLPAGSVINGATLDLALGTTPNTNWATAVSSAPPSYGGNGDARPPRVQVGPTGPIGSGLAGKCLDAAGGGTSNGTHAQSYACNGTAAQHWTLPGDGSVTQSGKCLDVSGGSTADGAPVQLWDCNQSDGQKWIPRGSALVNTGSGKCLDIPNSGTADGIQLQIFDCNNTAAQQWTLPRTRTGAAPSALAGKCLDDNAAATANGNRIQSWSCNGSPAQSVTVPGDGTLRIFGRCVSASGGGTGNNTPVVLWDCNGSTGQQWAYDATARALRNPQSGRCLDVPNSGTADGIQLQLFDCNGTPAQQWTLPTA